MMKKKPLSSTSLVHTAAVLLVALLLAAAAVAGVGVGVGVVDAAAAAAATAAVAPSLRCNPTLLTPCAGPVLFGGPVPAACCAQLRAQAGCLCAYAWSPNYGSYIRSPHARHLFSVCRLLLPRCP